MSINCVFLLDGHNNLEKELINRNIHIPRDMIRDSVNELIYQDSRKREKKIFKNTSD